jgi:hypothetical protein
MITKDRRNRKLKNVFEIITRDAAIRMGGFLQHPLTMKIVKREEHLGKKVSPFYPLNLERCFTAIFCKDMHYQSGSWRIKTVMEGMKTKGNGFLLSILLMVLRFS